MSERDVDADVAVSVIIPAFNAAATISDQLQALANQDTVEGFEVIVADNNSTDATVDVVEKFAVQHHFPVRVVDAREHQTPGYARNVGVRASAGEVLLFCDADDIAEESWVRLLAADVRTNGAAAGFLSKFADVDGPEIPVEVVSARQNWKEVSEFLWPVTACFGIRQSLFQELGGFDTRLSSGEDVDLGMRLLLSDARLAQSQATMKYRMRSSAVAERRQLSAYARWDSVLQRRYADLLRKHGVAPETMVDACRSVLGHLRRRRQVVTEYGRFAWETWLLTRLHRVRGHVDIIIHPELVVRK